MRQREYTLRMGLYTHKILKSSQLSSNAKPNNKFNIRLQVFGHQYRIDEVVSLIKSLDNFQNSGMFPYLYLLTIRINCFPNLEIKTNLVVFLRIFTNVNWINKRFKTIELILYKFVGLILSTSRRYVIETIENTNGFWKRVSNEKKVLKASLKFFSTNLLQIKLKLHVF